QPPLSRQRTILLPTAPVRSGSRVTSAPKIRSSISPVLSGSPVGFSPAWEGFDRKPRYLRVKFRPETASRGRLPHATGAGAVEELLLTNGRQAADMLLGAETAARLLAKTLLSAEGNATVTIGEYQTVVECDHRWYLARLVAVEASRDIAVAAGESQHSAC